MTTSPPQSSPAQSSPPQSSDPPLSVAVTGPTGTFGFGLMPLLQADDRIGTVIGIARRPFDPSEHGWSKMVYRRGDVRDLATLEDAFSAADVVVHLAFLILGGPRRTTQAVNVEGTVNAFRAAARAGAKRFVYASSVAAYGFHRDNPVGMTEEWATRPADRLFYAQEKAQLEHRLSEEARAHPGIDLYLLRPPFVLGPHAAGAKVPLPAPLVGLGKLALAGWRRVPIPVLAPVPDLPLQVIHESDVGQALLQCVVAAGPPGAYNIAADDVVSSLDVARELGVVPIPVPAAPVQAGARALARLPGLPSPAQWVEAASHPAIMSTTKARTELHWTPRYTALEALRASLK